MKDRENDFSIEDIDQPPEHKQRALDFQLRLLMKVTPESQNVLIASHINPLNFESLEKVSKEFERQQDKAGAREFAQLADEFDRELAVKTEVSVRISGNSEEDIFGTVNLIDGHASELNGKREDDSMIRESDKFPEISTIENPSGYVDGLKYCVNLLYFFEALDED